MPWAEFEQLIHQNMRELYRHMPWREEPTFYYVLVSEVMLQQTQVDRVRAKFAEFVDRFPSIEQLASASLADVISVWVGLGYNRRAKYLHEAARYVVAHGQPRTLDELIKLPGVGHNTAAAIMNYVYQVPTAFVETNIRSVYFKHFFAGRTNIDDSEIVGYVKKTMDYERPREFFWALMDYGAWLKAHGQSGLHMSRHYKKQPPLQGSIRQIRGQIIRSLADGSISESALRQAVVIDDRFDRALAGLQRDGLVVRSEARIYLTNSPLWGDNKI